MSTLADVAPYDGPRAELGVIGGSGLYTLLDDARQVAVRTPWGEPSDELSIGTVAGRGVAFLPRHGRGHRLPPHRVDHRSNLWALRTVGVRRLVTVSAVGSLRPDLPPGTLVLPDQVLDRTWGRPHTYYDAPGAVVHVPFADPYCPAGRASVLSTATACGEQVVDGGTLVVVQGPRFSSRAESRWHAASGGTLVGMTGMPETGLARELALCCTALSIVTDLDAGAAAGEGVTHAEVLAVFERSLARVRALVLAALADLPGERTGCRCAAALDGVRLPFPLP